MEVTDRDIARIPPGNVRVPRAQFAAVWRAAERLSYESGVRREPDWYAGAVATTCRWLATTMVRRPGWRVAVAQSPVGRQLVHAYEELIETETVAADNLALRRPDLVKARPGWCEGIRDALAWAWRQEGPPPVPSTDGFAAGGASLRGLSSAPLA